MLLRMSSLRTKIIAWSFIPTTIILVAVVLVSLYAYQRITEDLVTGRNRELTRLAASKLSTEMREYADLLSAVARTDVSDPDPATRRQALARAANQLVIFDGGVVVLNPRGVVVAGQPERPEALGHDWSNRSYFLTPEEISLLSAIGQKVGIATENARLYEQAERSAATAERNCLARDLHDAVSQTLFSASLIAEVLPRLWECNPDEVRRRLGELRQLTRGALAEMRTLLLELRPSTLSEGALGDLLRQLCEATTGRARLPVTLQVDGERTLPPEVQVAPYRIVQEALNNVAKHSGAEHASVEVQLSPQGLELSVSDDGRGFDRAAVPVNHMGLGIMSDRAEAIDAELRIVSEPGQGTEVTVIWRDAAASEQADINVREGSLS